jgi:hypothetical protein
MFSPTPKLISLAAVAASLAFATSASAADIGVAIKSDHTIARFSTDAPGTPLSPPKPITGLTTGESPAAVDFRPSTGQLYLLAVNDANATGHLYKLDPVTGVASAPGNGAPISGLAFDTYDIDFNPVTEKIRLVAGRLSPQPTSLHEVIDPDKPAVIPAATPAYVAGDPKQNSSVHLAAGAYSNNRPGADNTTFFGIENRTLVRIGSLGGSPDSPDGGRLTSTGDLPEDTISFFPDALDVSGDNAYATVNKKFVNGAQVTNRSVLVTVDLATAKAVGLGFVLDDFIIDMAIVPPPATPTTPTPTGTGTTGTTTPAPPADPAPVLSSVSLSRKAFAPVTARPARKATRRANRVKRGSTLRYTLSEAARVEIVISRKVRRGKRARFVKRATLRVRGKAGRNATRLTGKIGKRALAAGSYRFTLTAIDSAGQHSAKRTVSFRVLRG